MPWRSLVFVQFIKARSGGRGVHSVPLGLTWRVLGVVGLIRVRLFPHSGALSDSGSLRAVVLALRVVWFFRVQWLKSGAPLGFRVHSGAAWACSGFVGFLRTRRSLDECHKCSTLPMVFMGQR